MAWGAATARASRAGANKAACRNTALLTEAAPKTILCSQQLCQVLVEVGRFRRQHSRADRTIDHGPHGDVRRLRIPGGNAHFLNATVRLNDKYLILVRRCMGGALTQVIAQLRLHVKGQHTGRLHSPQHAHMIGTGGVDQLVTGLQQGVAGGNHQLQRVELGGHAASDRHVLHLLGEILQQGIKCGVVLGARMQTVEPQLEQHARLQPLLGFQRALAQQSGSKKPRISPHLAGNGSVVQTGIRVPLVGARLEHRTADADGLSRGDLGTAQQQNGGKYMGKRAQNIHGVPPSTLASVNISGGSSGEKYWMLRRTRPVSGSTHYWLRARKFSSGMRMYSSTRSNW